MITTTIYTKYLCILYWGIQLVLEKEGIPALKPIFFHVSNTNYFIQKYWFSSQIFPLFKKIIKIDFKGIT